jgi:drug/metabolite transporter (DMT)-like permease
MAKKGMSQKRLIGIVLLVVGVILIGWGLNEAGSFGGKLSSAISGSPSDRVLWFYISGAVCALIGLFNLFKK